MCFVVDRQVHSLSMQATMSRRRCLDFRCPSQIDLLWLPRKAGWMLLSATVDWHQGLLLVQ